jgi:hypothetical protein
VGVKKQVVMPLCNSLQVRECVVELSSLGGNPIASTELKELLIWPFVEALKREV